MVALLEQQEFREKFESKYRGRGSQKHVKQGEARTARKHRRRQGSEEHEAPEGDNHDRN